jgi:pyruvate ferredoxin oxidoreductase beta subunit
MTKAQKGVAADGPAFLNVIAPCPRGWRHEPEETIEMARMAVETCYWPLYEVENGQWKLNFKPREKKPITAWLERQGRFRHLFQPQFRHVIDEIQAKVDEEWERLLERCGE